MRRLTTLLAAAALLAAACTDDPTTEAGQEMVDLIESASSTSSTTTTVPPETTTTDAPSTTTTAPPTTTNPPTTTTSTTTVPAGDEDLQGMCGDGIPVVTDDGTTCVDPDTLPPAPVDLGTPWALPTADASIVEERWWHEPLVLVNQDSLTLLERVSEFDAPRLTPWARLDAWADEVRVSVDGAIVAQQIDPASESIYEPNEVVVYRVDGTRTVVPDARRLYDLAELDGRSVIVVADAPGDDEYDAELDLELRQLDDPSTPGPTLGWATAPEYGVGTVDIDGGLAVVTAWADLTESVEYRDLGGAAISDLPSPTDDLAYNAPPYVVAATLSPDGTHVTWAEGPDWDGATGGFEAAPWRIKRMRLADGEVVLEWPITDELADLDQLQVVSTHDLGDHIVVNMVMWRLERWWPIQATVIDLAYEEPDSYRLPITGIAVPVPYVLE